MTVSFWWQEPSLVTKVPSVGCVMDEEKRNSQPLLASRSYCEKVTDVKNMIPSCALQGPTWSGFLSPPSDMVSLQCLQWTECPLPHTFLLGSPLPVRLHFLLSMAGSFLPLGCQAECHVPLPCIHFPHSTVIAIGQLLIVLYLFPSQHKCVLFTTISLLCPSH